MWPAGSSARTRTVIGPEAGNVHRIRPVAARGRLVERAVTVEIERERDRIAVGIDRGRGERRRPAGTDRRRQPELRHGRREARVGDDRERAHRDAPVGRLARTANVPGPGNACDALSPAPSSNSPSPSRSHATAPPAWNAAATPGRTGPAGSWISSAAPGLAATSTLRRLDAICPSSSVACAPISCTPSAKLVTTLG